MRARRRAATLACVAIVAPSLASVVRAHSAAECAALGFVSSECSVDACDNLRSKTASVALYDECRACCAASNDAAVPVTYARALVRVCS